MVEDTKVKVNEIIKAFGLSFGADYFAPYGEGHINRTFLLVLEDGQKYIVQKINNRIFKDVAALMKNIAAVIDHLAKKGGRHLQYIRTAEGGSYFFDGEGYFRVYDFIDNSVSYQTVENPAHFFAAAAAFAKFQRMLGDFDAAKLTEVLPGFHDTVKRFFDFKAAIAWGIPERLKKASPEIDFALKREGITAKITGALKSGEIPLRVTHNDTKLNNVLIDNISGEGVVIDFDTIMPGSLLYDFGDAIRFGASSAKEDEADLTKVAFRLDLFEVYAEGFLKHIGKIEESERENLAFSALLMTYECGIRFLADYLSGDTYFRTAYPEHNLVRAKNQFKLAADMERAMPEMEKIIKKYS